jgi:hypothetical protein
MSLPSPNETASETASAALSTASFAQDVVLATSRAIHGESPTSRDRAALTTTRLLLERLLSTTVALQRGDDRLLAAAPTTLAALRAIQTRRPPTHHHFREIIQTVDQVLSGTASPETRPLLNELRELFLAVGQVNLDTITSLEKKSPPDAWLTLTLSSTS